MEQPREVELVFAPQEEGGFHVYAPDLPGLHTQGDTLEEAMANASEALELYAEGLREEGHPLDFGVVRRKFPIPASTAVGCRSSLGRSWFERLRRLAGRLRVSAEVTYGCGTRSGAHSSRCRYTKSSARDAHRHPD